MKKKLQMLLTLATIFALTSIVFTIGTSITGFSVKGTDPGMYFSYLTIITIIIAGLILYLDYKKFRHY